MARFERKSALDVGERAVVFVGVVVDGRALVPTFGEIGLGFDDLVENSDSGAEGAHVHRHQRGGEHLVHLGIARAMPLDDDAKLDLLARGFRRRMLEFGEELIEARASREVGRRGRLDGRRSFALRGGSRGGESGKSE
jgi:hypothetical protein